LSTVWMNASCIMRPPVFRKVVYNTAAESEGGSQAKLVSTCLVTTRERRMRRGETYLCPAAICACRWSQAPEEECRRAACVRRRNERVEHWRRACRKVNTSAPAIRNMLRPSSGVACAVATVEWCLVARRTARLHDIALNTRLVPLIHADWDELRAAHEECCT
jgi:hypothetical protein